MIPKPEQLLAGIIGFIGNQFQLRLRIVFLEEFLRGLFPAGTIVFYFQCKLRD